MIWDEISFFELCTIFERSEINWFDLFGRKEVAKL